MNNAIVDVFQPHNEPQRGYLPGSAERQGLVEELDRQAAEPIEIPLIINGREVLTGITQPVVMPHDHRHVLALCHQAREQDVRLAIQSALEAREAWMTMSWVERASIFLKIAELLSKKYRARINAATMLGQGKNAFQAEIDAACESIDFLRYNIYFAAQIYNQQPKSDTTTLNRLEYRPLEGFVLAISPFNFTAIGANLSTSPAIMGNTVVWKPAPAAALSNYCLMKVFQEAGLPDGVINFIPGDGPVVAGITLAHRNLAGLHFTGGTATFNHLWRTVCQNLDAYQVYPRLVGETGGKGFVFVHPSGDALEVAVALVRGGFEYQGQKCSAASRAYIPRSKWPAVRQLLRDMLAEVRMGDVRDFDSFVNAVIDERAFDRITRYIGAARGTKDAEIIIGGTSDKTRGYFIEPTVIQAFDPHFVTMEEEIFGPVLTVFVYDDDRFDETLRLCDQTSPYALTGAIFAREREVLVRACRTLRHAAGNFYYNDKPTGAMVGMQPFGGARRSGTNDKAGGFMNMIRWTSPRTIKETLVPATTWKYPYMSS